MNDNIEYEKFAQEIYNDLLAELNYKRFMFKKLCILLGTFSKYYKISQLIHTQNVAN